jgi:hypothetical protein
MYKTMLKPIWTYGIKFWRTASTSNTEIVERFQSKALSKIVDARTLVRAEYGYSKESPKTNS